MGYGHKKGRCCIHVMIQHCQHKSHMGIAFLENHMRIFQVFSFIMTVRESGIFPFNISMRQI